MITPELKNLVLQWIIENAPELNISIEYILVANQLEIPEAILISMLDHFERKGLITIGRRKGCGLVKVNIEAHEFMREGAFVGEEEILMTEFRKLQFEIESLHSTIDKNKYDKILTGINTVLSFFSLTMGK